MILLLTAKYIFTTLPYIIVILCVKYYISNNMIYISIIISEISYNQMLLC